MARHKRKSDLSLCDVLLSLRAIPLISKEQWEALNRPHWCICCIESAMPLPSNSASHSINYVWYPNAIPAYLPLFERRLRTTPYTRLVKVCCLAAGTLMHDPGYDIIPWRSGFADGGASGQVSGWLLPNRKLTRETAQTYSKPDLEVSLDA